MITVLTRTMPGREPLLERLVKSIDFPVNHVIYCDERLRVDKIQYDWNLFCNSMMARVWQGWFLFADDDDYFWPGALQRLSTYLTDDCQGLIVQYLRNGQPKPPSYHMERGIIKEGFIGGGCLVLHSRHRDVANWDGKRRADYRWIKAVSEKVELRFLELVLQITDNNGRFGK